MPQRIANSKSALTLRRMCVDDLAAGLSLTQAARWSHRLSDWQFHFSLGNGWVACDAHDRVVGTAMWWPYGDTFATLGLIVVDGGLQGQGIGRQLMAVVMSDAAPRTLQLVATPAGLKLYQQCGFVALGDIEQHQGNVLPGAALPRQSGTPLRSLTRDDLPGLCALDAAAFGARRDAVIDAIFNQGSGVVAQRDGRLLGFAMLRSAGLGTTIGPVVAEDQQLAKALIERCLDNQSGIMRVDIPTPATDLSRWLETRGLACVTGATLMRRGDLPAVAAPTQLFGLVSQALG